MRVIAFTGLPGAGKTEAVALAQEGGIPVVRMGDFVRAETRRRGLQLVDANMGKVASEMRAKHGMDYWARLTCDAILKEHAAAGLVVVDGVRNPEEIETLRSRLGHDFTLIAILAPEETRAKRLMKRSRTDDAENLDDFLRREKRELRWGIERSMAMADHRIENKGDLATFGHEVETLLDRLRSSS